MSGFIPRLNPGYGDGGWTGTYQGVFDTFMLSAGGGSPVQLPAASGSDTVVCFVFVPGPL